MRDFLTAMLLMEATQLFPHYSPRVRFFFLALRQLCFGRAIAVVRLRRNQNSAMLPFFNQIEDQTKASEILSWYFCRHNPPIWITCWFQLGHACLRTLQALR